MKKYSAYLLVLLLIACTNSSDTSSDKRDSSVKETAPPSHNNNAQPQYQGCYMQVAGRDTILLHLDQRDDRFTGKMEFDNYEKDASYGTINGHLEDGNIVLWYDFHAEGMRSVMEVVLKPVSTGLVRAIGDITSNGDTTLLQQDRLNFDASNTMARFDCAGWH